MNRRGFLGAILTAGVAPAFVSAGVLMPVRQVWVPWRVEDFDFGTGDFTVAFWGWHVEGLRIPPDPPLVWLPADRFH